MDAIKLEQIYWKNLDEERNTTMYKTIIAHISSNTTSPPPRTSPTEGNTQTILPSLYPPPLHLTATKHLGYFSATLKIKPIDIYSDDVNATEFITYTKMKLNSNDNIFSFMQIYMHMHCGIILSSSLARQYLR